MRKINKREKGVDGIGTQERRGLYFINNTIVNNTPIKDINDYTKLLSVIQLVDILDASKDYKYAKILADTLDNIRVIPACILFKIHLHMEKSKINTVCPNNDIQRLINILWRRWSKNKQLSNKYFDMANDILDF